MIKLPFKDLRENQVLIFKNYYKNAPDQPDWVGCMMVEGEPREISLWSKTSKRGKLFYSGKNDLPKDYKLPDSMQKEKPKEEDVPDQYKQPEIKGNKNLPFD